MTYLDEFSVDHWDEEKDGVLNQSNIEQKLTKKYGHRCNFVPVVEKGTYLPDHTHEMTKADAVLKGELELTIVDGTTKERKPFVLKDGDILYLPANTIHSARAITECAFYDSFV